MSFFPKNITLVFLNKISARIAIKKKKKVGKEKRLAHRILSV